MPKRMLYWQRDQMIREFLAERDARSAAHGAAFAIGQRVRVVGGQLTATVTEILASKRVRRYRLKDSPFLYFESDLEAAR